MASLDCSRIVQSCKSTAVATDMIGTFFFIRSWLKPSTLAFLSVVETFTQVLPHMVVSHPPSTIVIPCELFFAN